MPWCSQQAQDLLRSLTDSRGWLSGLCHHLSRDSGPHPLTDKRCISHDKTGSSINRHHEPAFETGVPWAQAQQESMWVSFFPSKQGYWWFLCQCLYVWPTAYPLWGTLSSDRSSTVGSYHSTRDYRTNLPKSRQATWNCNKTTPFLSSRMLKEITLLLPSIL